MKQQIPPSELKSKCLDHAKGICDKAQPKTWASQGNPYPCTWDNIASLFKANNPNNVNDCPAALVLCAGECQPDSANSGCVGDGKTPYSIWQNGANTDDPDASAKKLYEGTTSATYICKGSPKTVPKCYISAGNENFIGPFCHVSQFGGAGWGGGMCAGGL